MSFVLFVRVSPQICLPAEFYLSFLGNVDVSIPGPFFFFFLSLDLS